MSGISCYVSSCVYEVEMLCNCTSPPVYFCKKHLIKHCLSSEKPHNFTWIISEPLKGTKEAILNFLSEQRLNNYTIKAKTVASFCQAFQSLEKLLKETVKEIDSDFIKLDSYFDKVSNAKEISNLEKDPVLSLLTLQSYEAIEKAKTIFEKNNKIELINKAICQLDQNISTFNKKKLKDDQRNILFELEIIEMTFEKDCSEELKLYKNTIRRDPNNDSAYWGIARIFAEENRYEEAIKYLNHAISISPKKSFYYFSKGMYFKNFGKSRAAVECFRQAISIEPNNALIYEKIGDIFYDKKNYEEAIKYYNDAIRVNPNKHYYLNKEDALIKLGRENEAENYSEEASKWD